MNRYLKEPFNCISHALGAVFGLWCFVVLIPWDHHEIDRIFVACVFYGSMIFLYSASALYHGLPLHPLRFHERIRIEGIQANTSLQRKLQALDHCGIFLLIAGSYTPVCYLAFWDSGGFSTLIYIWIIAVLGMLFKVLWLARLQAGMAGKFFKSRYSAVIYIVMGYLILIDFPELVKAMPSNGVLLFVLGGVSYTIGGIIHALKRPNPFVIQRTPLNHYFGFHEIFHVFILLGTFMHTYALHYYVISAS